MSIRHLPATAATETIQAVLAEDGVVVVPNEQAAAVLKRAIEIDQRESKMVPLIQQLKALGKAVQQFNRI